jgi:hypothetical protein
MLTYEVSIFPRTLDVIQKVCCFDWLGINFRSSFVIVPSIWTFSQRITELDFLVLWKICLEEKHLFFKFLTQVFPGTFPSTRDVQNHHKQKY